MGCFASLEDQKVAHPEMKEEKMRHRARQAVETQMRKAIKAARELSPERVIQALSPSNSPFNSPRKRLKKRNRNASLMLGTFQVQVEGLSEKPIIVPDMGRYDTVLDLRIKLAKLCKLPEITVFEVPLYCWSCRLVDNEVLQAYDIPWNGTIVSTEKGWNEDGFKRQICSVHI